MINRQKPSKNPLTNYVKFSAVAIQMGVVIGLGAVLGSWLDDKLGLTQPLATAAGALLGVGVALYVVLKELKNMS